MKMKTTHNARRRGEHNVNHQFAVARCRHGQPHRVVRREVLYVQNLPQGRFHQDGFQRRRRHPDRHGGRSVAQILAENTVASLPGVKSVDNQLVVSGEQPAEHSDTWITTKVKTALLFHRNVSATGTTFIRKTASSPCKAKRAAWRKRNSPPNTPRTLTTSNRSITR
jgi:osmotically-inducible protein OsmY